MTAMAGPVPKEVIEYCRGINTQCELSCPKPLLLLLMLCGLLWGVLPWREVFHVHRQGIHAAVSRITVKARGLVYLLLLLALPAPPLLLLAPALMLLLLLLLPLCGCWVSTKQASISRPGLLVPPCNLLLLLLL
jgi:hypothetical protein